MKKKFPESYPYFNKHGMAFTAQSLNLVAKYFLERRKPLSLEFGIEISYILLWCMEKAKDPLHFIKLASFYFRKMVRMKHKRPINTNSELLERILEPDSYTLEDRVLKKVDIHRTIGDDDRVQELLDLRSRDRKKEIEKLKKYWEGE